MSLKEAAYLRGVSERTIRRMIAAGKLPAERLGARMIRIRTADLDRIGHPIGGDAA
ncbi:excisionase family DNA-binding protein [Georgenia sp. AZ-5]|uniref:excisionase family DNA-binding protein n=1 Tax=Georgenia sp. AZ-5 TaxID=3367526 RepID=UPI003754C1D6